MTLHYPTASCLPATKLQHPVLFGAFYRKKPGPTKPKNDDYQNRMTAITEDAMAAVDKARNWSQAEAIFRAKSGTFPKADRHLVEVLAKYYNKTLYGIPVKDVFKAIYTYYAPQWRQVEESQKAYPQEQARYLEKLKACEKENNSRGLLGKLLKKKLQAPKEPYILSSWDIPAVGFDHLQAWGFGGTWYAGGNKTYWKLHALMQKLSHISVTSEEGIPLRFANNFFPMATMFNTFVSEAGFYALEVMLRKKFNQEAQNQDFETFLRKKAD